MDPNANLKEQRRLINRILAGEPNDPKLADMAIRLAELAQALDEWMSNGGFMPEAWPRKR